MPKKCRILKISVPLLCILTATVTVQIALADEGYMLLPKARLVSQMEAPNDGRTAVLTDGTIIFVKKDGYQFIKYAAAAPFIKYEHVPKISDTWTNRDGSIIKHDLVKGNWSNKVDAPIGTDRPRIVYTMKNGKPVGTTVPAYVGKDQEGNEIKSYGQTAVTYRDGTVKNFYANGATMTLHPEGYVSTTPAPGEKE